MYLRNKLYTKRMKQTELAKLVGVNPATISLWCSETLPIPKKHIPRVAEVLGASVIALEKLGR